MLLFSQYINKLSIKSLYAPIEDFWDCFLSLHLDFELVLARVITSPCQLATEQKTNASPLKYTRTVQRKACHFFRNDVMY
jgi:hypothetical protein